MSGHRPFFELKKNWTPERLAANAERKAELHAEMVSLEELRADLGISRRTFYEWRAKGRAPRCITLPNGSLRIRRSEYQRWLAAHEEAA